MIVKVRFFALTREIVGKNEITETLPDGSTLNDFTQSLYANYPQIKVLGIKFAINMNYAPLDTVLNDADEIACIPPVGGG